MATSVVVVSLVSAVSLIPSSRRASGWVHPLGHTAFTRGWVQIELAGKELCFRADVFLHEPARDGGYECSWQIRLFFWFVAMCAGTTK